MATAALQLATEPAAQRRAQGSFPQVRPACDTLSALTSAAQGTWWGALRCLSRLSVSTEPVLSVYRPDTTLYTLCSCTITTSH